MAASPLGQRSPSRFGVYENAAISSALAAQPAPNKSVSRAVLALVFAVISWGMMSITFRKEAVGITMRSLHLNYAFAKIVVKIVQATVTLLFLGAISALCKMALSYDAIVSTKKTSQAPQLTPRQQALIGRRNPKTPSTRPRSSPAASPSPNTMFPLHPPMPRGHKVGSSTSASTQVTFSSSSPRTPLQVSSFPYASPTASPQESNFNPWAVGTRNDDIRNEGDLEKFVAEVGTKMVESTGKTPSTPQGLISSGVGASPSLISTTQPGSAVIRTIRVSPTQKSGASPKKAEGDLPAPFTMEQAIEGFRRLGVYPEIEQWRDGLRQWFSDVLLRPLVRKLDKSHLQVMEAAAKLGVNLQISPIGGAKKDNGSSPRASTEGSEWHTTFAPDEDAMIHQFRASLLNARRESTTSPTIFGLRPLQQPEVNSQLQECLDAVTEHQRLKALVKGEWVKGLLPQSSVRADYTIQRLRELAEGTCVKNYEFAGTGEVYDKTRKRWSLELPTDAHLLVYLFCALLEHPQWMLHVDPTSYPSTQSGNDPLFIANLPQKERFPEKYVAVLSSAPPVLHSAACILAVGKQSPPVFALYWDKRLQFSLQGRTALWDAILLFCHRIKACHGGIVRGLNLGGSAFNLLPLLDQHSSGKECCSCQAA